MHNNLGYILQKENNNLDLIRLLLAFGVIYGHVPIFILYSKHYDIVSKIFPFTYCGNMAVLAFFFISGLLVSNSLFLKKNILDYLLSRIFRIYPALIVVLILSCILSFKYSDTTLHRYFHHAWMYFYHNITMNFVGTIDTVSYMTQNYPLNGQYAQVTNGSLWTIPLEIKMYWLLLASYLFATITKSFKKPVLPIILSIGILSPYIFSSQLLGGNNRETLYLIPMFCLGALFAYYKDKIAGSLSLLSALFIEEPCMKLKKTISKKCSIIMEKLCKQ